MLSQEILTDRLAHLTRKYGIKKAALGDITLLDKLSQMKSEVFSRIIKAMQKINNQPEEYGLCENCAEPIPLKRLVSLPEATLCLDCQKKEEQSGKRNGRCSEH
ncbi:MAG: TraR/DksA C4-type zinc finger protein [Patescibacteria group bacterium]